MSELTEEQLIKGCISNDPKAQKQLFDKYKSKMMGVCLRYSDSREEAEDIFQNAFVKVFENLHSFRMEGSLEGWVRRIMVNMALNHYRQNKNSRNNIDIDDAGYVAESAHGVIESISAKELLLIIRELPSGFRNVFNLYAIEGYTHKEIANELGISEGTSKSQYARARAFIQKKLERLKITQN